jgi:cytochrome c oxidase assembly factor CtaG
MPPPARLLRTWPARLGALALLLTAPLLAWNLSPNSFPPHAHDLLAGAPLALIAVTYLLNRALRRPTWRALLQTLMLSTGFLLWAATQFWPQLPCALVLNDIAIGLFVLDLFLVIAQTPAPVVDDPGRK